MPTDSVYPPLRLSGGEVGLRCGRGSCLAPHNLHKVLFLLVCFLFFSTTGTADLLNLEEKNINFGHEFKSKFISLQIILGG